MEIKEATALYWRRSFRKLYIHLCIYTANLLSVLVGIIISWNLNCNLQENCNKAWYSSLLPLSASPMPLIFSYIASKFGRKLCLLLTCLPLLFCDLVLSCSTCTTPPKTYILARFLAGIALGGLTTILPLYIHELSISARKQYYSHSYRVFISLGIFISFSTESYTIPHAFVITFLLLFVTMYITFMPETPQYLISSKHELKAKAVLIRLRNSPLIDPEFRVLWEKYSQSLKLELKNILKIPGSTIATNLITVILKECTTANIVVFFARDIFQYVNVINLRIIPPWEPPGVSVQVCILGVTQFLIASGFWYCLHYDNEKDNKIIVGTCFIVVFIFGLIPLAWYFKVINRDVNIIGDIYKIDANNQTDIKSLYELNKNVNYSNVNLKEMKAELTIVSQNVKVTCWIPLLSFCVIMSCHHVLSLRIDSLINDTNEQLWMRAFHESFIWILWFCSSVIFKSLEMELTNNIWNWWMVCAFGCFLGMAVTFTYLTSNKNIV